MSQPLQAPLEFIREIFTIDSTIVSKQYIELREIPVVEDVEFKIENYENFIFDHHYTVLKVQDTISFPGVMFGKYVLTWANEHCRLGDGLGDIITSERIGSDLEIQYIVTTEEAEEEEEEDTIDDEDFDRGELPESPSASSSSSSS